MENGKASRLQTHQHPTGAPPPNHHLKSYRERLGVPTQPTLNPDQQRKIGQISILDDPRDLAEHMEILDNRPDVPPLAA